MNLKDVKIEFTKGKGPGGQHKNKTESAVRVTHVPTGTTVFIDGRNQHSNKKKALAELQKRLKEHEEDKLAIQRKERRNKKITQTKRVRTYDCCRNVVKDHRTGKKASIKEILEKGNLDLFYED